MTFRSSRKTKAGKAKETVTEQVSDRTDDLVAALDAAREALARASAAASRKGAELSKEAADKLLPERARQRRREAARRRNRKLLAGAAGLTLLGVAFSRLAGGKGDRERLERQAEHDAGWAAESTSDAGPAPSAEVTQLHGNGAGADTARTPPAN
jgi:adenine-specific DNA methylase